MNYKNFFSNDYLLLKINDISQMLNELPSLIIVKRRRNNKETISIRQVEPISRKAMCEYYIDTPQGKKLLSTLHYKNDLQNMLKEYTLIYTQKTGRKPQQIRPEVINLLKGNDFHSNDMKFYNSLIHEQAFRDFGEQDRKLEHRGMHFTSKLEMNVAEILDNLDLEYKHEPKIQLGMKGKYTDFFVGVPLINYCFPIEVAGLLEKSDYLLKLNQDIGRYIESGYLFDHDLLLIGETKFHQYNSNEVVRIICNFINNKIADALEMAGVDDLC